MALIDDVHITVKAGDGGRGGSAKKQLFGSKKTVPDGGNGGSGGNVFVKGDHNLSDLSQFRFQKNIKAENGVDGKHKDLDGANGEDTTIVVPFGTTIQDEDTNEWVEITDETAFCLAYGGTGGMGNHDYKPDLSRSSTRIIEGQRGEERNLHLILNLIADIGLVGKPNAGKSSLLKVLTNAEPKIGNYPFTTIEPNLGVVDNIVLADIPGLIAGASGGKGLGIQFLKHIKKTKMLFHCISAEEQDPVAIYDEVRNEFGKFDESLLKKEELVVVTKSDLAPDTVLEDFKEKFRKLKKNVITVSIYEQQSIENLMSLIATYNKKG